MKAAVRIVAGIVVVLLLIIAGLSAFVRFYLTGERLEAMLVPPVQKALGRDVTIGSINVSLFKGITVDGFTVKELDGKQDFVSAGSFILRYDLMPLLQKKFVVSEIRLEQPAVRIHREILNKRRMTGLHFWARGYCVSTVGLDEKVVRKYIREQEAIDKRQMELELE